MRISLFEQNKPEWQTKGKHGDAKLKEEADGIEA